MQFLQYFYSKTIKYDLINKFLYKNVKKIPKFKKIMLIFQEKNNDLKFLAPCLLALEIISKQKGVFTLSKHSNILIKVRKGEPIGCKVTLRKNVLFGCFLNDLINIFPKLKKLRMAEKNICFYQIDDLISFQALEANYRLFNNLPTLKVVVAATTETHEEFKFFLKSLKLPV